MSPAAMRKPQPGGEHDQGVVLFVSTPAGGLDEPFSVGAEPVAERIGLSLVVPVKQHGEASPVSQTIRDIESATVERLREKGFDWGNVFRRRLDPSEASDSVTRVPRTIE